MGSELTVVVPVYNVEKYLGKCIDSILDQTLAVDEIILVDDGSKDKSDPPEKRRTFCSEKYWY